MPFIDVFNGDADGICALHQLRLNDPRPDAQLVTGVKRDISLLSRLHSTHQSDITVLDISLDRNRESLQLLLDQDNRVRYIDHHFCGDIPDSKNLTLHIDPLPQTCTSVIVDSLLNGEHRTWAIAGAFGDNLDETGDQLARSLDLDRNHLDQLREIGILLNYNGYGASLDDLFFTPDELYRQVSMFTDPFVFYKQSSALKKLQQGYNNDMNRAMKAQPINESDYGRIFELPAEPWARRVAGVYSNTLARQKPEMAHALVTPNSDTTLRISVRAPLNNRTGADTLCRQFPTGGGRAAAAGVNNLPPDQAKKFADTFHKHFQATA